MTYVRKYPNLTKPPAEPKSVIGFVWRLRMLGNRIADAPDSRSCVIYRVTRSVTWSQAERLGAVPLEAISSKLGMANEPSMMDQHRRISANAHQLFKLAEHLPADEEALGAVTELLGSKMLGGLIYHRTINPRMSLDELRLIVRYSKAACAFGELRHGRPP
jgi:hypothetical protein